MTPSKILFYLCISFVIGIFLNSTFKIPQFILWGFLFLGVLIIFLSFVIRENPLFIRVNPLIIGFCVLFLVLGVLRMQVTEFNILNNELRKLNDKSESITLTGAIIAEPDRRDTSQKLKVEIENPKGTVLVTTSRYPDYQYLDKIKITGKLKTPSETEEFSYKDYLLKDHIYSVMDFPKVEFLGKDAYRSPASVIYSGILFFKQKLRESIRRNFSPPESLVLEGTVLGDNGVMTQDLKNKLNITGLRHIIAVSGTHIVILSSILMSFLLILGLWRGQAFYFSFVLIWLYIILTGLSASGLRAGIMGSIFLLAQKLGRQNASSRIIVMAGALMLLQNPLLLFYDVGFQLSFLASMGIIYLDPIIKSLINIFVKNKAQNFISIVSTTFAAQIFTLPVMVFNFGNMSLISPLTNLLVLPAVPGLMIFGFISSFAGVFYNFLGWIFSIPCWFFLAYFIKVADIFSQPWAIKTFENISWIWLAAFYLILGFTIRYFRKKYSQSTFSY